MGGLAAFAVLAAGCSDDSPQGPPPDDGNCIHIDYAGGVDLQTGTTMVFHQYGYQSTGGLTIPVGTTLTGVEVKFLDGNANPIPISNDCTIMRVEADVLNPAIVEMQREPNRRWTVDFVGKQAGTTTLRLELWHSTHQHFRSEPVPVTVIPVP